MDNLIGKVLWGDPLIFYTWWYSFISNNVFDEFQKNLSEKKCIFLLTIPWSRESRFENYFEPTQNILNWIDSRKSLFPNHRYIYLCNTPLEAFQLKRAGIDAEFFNQNIFLDPNIYKVIKSDKKYRSVYNAQFFEFKRHELLYKTSSCALISHALDQDYFKNVILPKSGINYEIINKVEEENGVYSIKGLDWLSLVEVINQAKVGLCLSKEEGAMYAAAEYLLCGLPVVTTLNSGGRDYLFDGRFVFYSSDDPFVINEAIDAMANYSFDPNLIRTETIRKQQEGIVNFCIFLEKLLYREINRSIDFKLLWPKIFYNKLFESKSLENHLIDIRSSDFK